MSARNSLQAKRARRRKREEIVSARLRRDREIEEHVSDFVATKISEMKEAARARLGAMTMLAISAEVLKHQEAGGDVPLGWRRMKKADLIEALVPTDRLTKEEADHIAWEIGG